MYILWHPDNEAGAATAEKLFKHFRRDVFKNAAGGLGISVLYRYAPLSPSGMPENIRYDESDRTLVVILRDLEWAADQKYCDYERQIREDEATTDSLRVIPVALHASALSPFPGTNRTNALQALQPFRWNIPDAERDHRIICDLTYRLCLLVRDLCDEVTESTSSELNIFLSHTKHDDLGQEIANGIRERLNERPWPRPFFDVTDIEPGTSFDRRILEAVPDNAMVAIHTDQYSSRPWCRKEVLTAKRHHVPMVVANALVDRDERGFPYMGNVPIVRLDAGIMSRSEQDKHTEKDKHIEIDRVIGRLFDEVLKDYLWEYRVHMTRRILRDRGREHLEQNTVFLPHPPELVSILGERVTGTTGSENRTIVYPEPPLGREECRLFEGVAPKITLASLTEWTISNLS